MIKNIYITPPLPSTPLFTKLKHCMIKTSNLNNKKIYYYANSFYVNITKKDNLVDALDYTKKDNLVDALDYCDTLSDSANFNYSIGDLNSMYYNQKAQNLSNNLKKINTELQDKQDKGKITLNNLNYISKIENVQNYKIIIVVILLLIIIIISIIFNLNSKANYVKYLLLLLIVLFIVIYIIDHLYLDIEPFTISKELYGFNKFKNIINTDNDYISYRKIQDNYKNLDNYASIYTKLTNEQLGENEYHIRLNKLITSFEILNVLYKYKNELILFKMKSEISDKYMTNINKNLKKEISKYNNLNKFVKRINDKTKQTYNNIYFSTTNLTDIKYLLIYVTIISIVINVIIIEFKFNYVNKKILTLYIFLFLIGIIVYLYRNMIKVRVDAHKMYYQ